MHRAALWAQFVLVPALGPFGLFVAAFLDSFLFLPELNDILVVSWSAAHPETAWVPVTMTTLGSLAGCSLIWWIGRRGGEPLLEKRFGVARLERTRAAFERWDLFALAVPAVLPPPVPFKIFVLSAGVFGVSYRRFAVSVGLARAVRYTAWSLMGIFYGEDAVTALKGVDAWFGREGFPVLVGSLGLAAASLALYYHRRRFRDAQDAQQTLL
jgi:membrane protein YqaA with SNARE-associated domain